MRSKEYFIEKLGLIKHPEGGWYKEVYRSGETVKAGHLPSRYSGDRCFGTSIYFLLDSDDFSAFHKIKSDEIWHFYSGSPLNIYYFDSSGKFNEVVLGDNPENNECMQFVIPGGCWFGAKVKDINSFSLAGCTVAPGFDFEDFELGKREKLISIYPDSKKIICELTRS